MKESRTPFPWHYYNRAVRSRLIWVTVSCALTYATLEMFPETFFVNGPMILMGLYACVFFSSYFRISPMRSIIKRTEQVQEKLPHGQKLDLIYRKNEFQLIEEMLNLAESQFQKQKEDYENKLIEAGTALEYIPDAIIIVDKFHNAKQLNTRFKDKFINEENGAELEKLKLWKIFLQPQIRETFDEAFRKGSPSKLQAFYFTKQNEYYDITATPISNNKGETLGALGVFHNVTASKLTEKMRVDFVANVSHEIRTPLTSIKGYSQLLMQKKENLPKDVFSALSKINSNTERLKDLFDNLLKLSVIESREELQKEAFDLQPFLDLIVSNLRGKWLNKKFRVVCESSARLYGDRKLLDQLFTNLIDNAVKYSDKEETLVTFDCYDAGECMQISVKDNGPGFSQEEGQRIFERFYRVQGQSKRPIEGSGLGLSIVKHIAKKHRGDVHASSLQGDGSTFTVTLPKML